METVVSALYEGGRGKCDKAHNIITSQKFYVCNNYYTSKKKIF